MFIKIIAHIYLLVCKKKVNFAHCKTKCESKKQYCIANTWKKYQALMPK